MIRRLPALLASAACAVGLATAMSGPAHAAPMVSVDAYRGAGAWVDIYSSPALRAPEAVVRRLASEGVRTLYLETANYRQRPHVDIVHPGPTARFITAAHAAGIRVVAWYLPGFADVDTDLRRSLAAIQFRTREGQGFDAFALDIESNVVNPIARRNAAAIELSRALRAAVGGSYPLGAIIPDARSTAPYRSLWPYFPYLSLGRIYNVFLPMTYSTFRVRGPGAIQSYIRYNVARVRIATRRAGAPVHPIGGLANGLNYAEARAFTAGARMSRALGTSFYNFGLTGPEEWLALRTSYPGV